MISPRATSTGKAPTKEPKEPKCKVRPPVKKLFLEDKLNCKKVQFSLLMEKDVKFFSHQVLKSQKGKTYVSYCHVNTLGQ